MVMEGQTMEFDFMVEDVESQMMECKEGGVIPSEHPLETEWWR